MSVFKKYSSDELKGGRLKSVTDYGYEVHLVYVMPDHSERVHRIYLSDDLVYEKEDIEVISKEEIDEQEKWLKKVCEK